MTGSLAIETQELTRTFGRRTAVHRLELRVPRGSIYGFLGPNGAGKTTTIRLLLGLLRPTRGTILLNGEPFTSKARGLLRNVGALAETPSLYSHLTGEENLEVTRRILHLPVARINEALALAGLAAEARQLVRTYSTGMRQRLGLALAWLRKPDLLLLDEPANGLDPAGNRDLRDLLLKLVREHGVTVFLSSHILSEVEQIADQIGIVHHGRLLFQGKLQDLPRPQEQLRVRVDQHSHADQLLRAKSWHVTEDSSHNLSVQVSSDAEAASVNRALVEAGVEVYALERKQKTLEELFFHLISTSEQGTAG